MAGWRVGALYPFDLDHGRRALARAVEFCKRWHGAAEGRITCMLGAHAPDMMPLEMLLEGRFGPQLEVDLLGFLSFELVPLFFLTDSPIALAAPMHAPGSPPHAPAVGAAIAARRPPGRASPSMRT